MKKNLDFFKLKLHEAFSLYDEENGTKQQRNEETFKRIFKNKKAKNRKALEDLIIYLNKTVEEIIIEYYNSTKFIDFSSDEEIIEKDKAFYKEKKFSLLKDYGFIKLIKNQYTI